MQRPTPLIALVAVLIGASGLATDLHAQDQREHGLFGPMFQEVRMARALRLDADQRKEFRAIMDAAREEMIPVAEQLMDNRHALRAMEREGAFDEARVGQLATEQGELIARMIVLEARTRSRVDALLSPEQRQRMQRMKSRHGKRERTPQD